MDTVLAAQRGYLVKIWVLNYGGSTATKLTVTGELKDQTGSVETSAITFDYVPAHSQREGGLFFTRDPQQFDM